MKKLFLLLIVWLPNFLLAGDSLGYKKIFIDAAGGYGFIVSHSPNMKHLIKKHIVSGEINFLIQTKGEKRWEQLYKNPEKGIGFYYASLGNPEQLGNAMGLYAFINFPLNPGRRIPLYFRSANGLGLITKPYDRISNHKNNVNGSGINAFINLRLNTVFYPSEKLRIETGIGLSHLSNGGFSKPNKGINMVVLNLSMSIPVKTIKTTTSKPLQTDSAAQKKYFATLIVATGINENSPPGGKHYLAFSLSPSIWKRLSRKSRICIGADAFYPFANIFSAIHDTIYDATKPLNTLQAGIRIGHELLIGKFSLPIEMGAYAFSKMKYLGRFYHRIGIRYQISEHFILNYTLRTHWATAEHIEVGLGYKF